MMVPAQQPHSINPYFPSEEGKAGEELVLGWWVCCKDHSFPSSLLLKANRSFITGSVLQSEYRKLWWWVSIPIQAQVPSHPGLPGPRTRCTHTWKVPANQGELVTLIHSESRICKVLLFLLSPFVQHRWVTQTWLLWNSFWSFSLALDICGDIGPNWVIVWDLEWSKRIWKVCMPWHYVNQISKYLPVGPVAT